MKENKVVKKCDIKQWTEYFGYFKNTTKYFGDIANTAQRTMVLGQMTDEIMTVTK